MADIEFPTGIFASKPKESAPNFKKAQIRINARETFKWLTTKAKSLDENDKGEIWISLDLLESKGGKYYLSVDNWKPQQETSVASESFEDDIPF